MKKKPYRYLIYLLICLLREIFRLLPRKGILFLARCVGTFAFYLLKKERMKTIQNLTSVFESEKTSQEIEIIAKKVFQHFAKITFDLTKFMTMPLSSILSLVDVPEEMIERYREYNERSDKGVIGLTGHFGNWELMAAIVSNFLEQDKKCYAIGKRIYYPKYNDLIISLRHRLGVETIYQDESIKQVIKLLKSGFPVGILPDQDMDHASGQFVDFFGKPAWTTDSIGKLVNMLDVPVFPCYLKYKKGDRYEFYLGKPFGKNKELSKEDDIRETTIKVSHSLEAMIRQAPEQWAWMHRRWKTQPNDIE